MKVHFQLITLILSSRILFKCDSCDFIHSFILVICFSLHDNCFNNCDNNNDCKETSNYDSKKIMPK